MTRVVQGRQTAVNPAHEGTKASAHYRQMVGPGQSMTVRLRLTSQALAVPFGPGLPRPSRPASRRRTSSTVP